MSEAQKFYDGLSDAEKENFNQELAAFDEYLKQRDIEANSRGECPPVAGGCRVINLNAWGEARQKDSETHFTKVLYG